MTTIARCVALLGLLWTLVGCTTLGPNSTRITLTQQWCKRWFGGDCPTITWKPPITLPAPTGPAPDLHLTAISCDNEPTFDPSAGIVWKNLVTAHISNDGDANAVPDSSGYSVTVTVVATVQNGSTEMLQNEWSGNFLTGESETFRIGPMAADWPRYSHVKVTVDTTVLNADRDYSNNTLESDVSPNALSDSTSRDTIYCENPKKGM